MGIYKPNSVEFNRLAHSPRLKKHMLAIGEYWANELRASAPRGKTGEVDATHYADSIDVVAVTVLIGKMFPLFRVGAQITANVPYAAILEVGAKHIPNPPRPMTKLLDRMQAADPKKAKR
jgi:hypothetical protein